jgi:hypothetical protein
MNQRKMNKCPAGYSEPRAPLYYAVIGTIYLGVGEREEETPASFRIARRFTDLTRNATELTQVAKRRALSKWSVVRR